jgi:hypothetical protein
MKSNFEITRKSISTQWLFWDDIAAVSVIPKFETEIVPESASMLRGFLIEGIERSFAVGCNRAFIFFKEEHFDLAQVLLTEFSENKTGFELNVELVEVQKNCHRYDYEGLTKFADQSSLKKLAILSFAPDREKQAKRLGVYL